MSSDTEVMRGNQVKKNQVSHWSNNDEKGIVRNTI